MTDWITTPITAEIVRGALELERTEYGVLPHRLLAQARTQNTDGQLAMAEAKPSGVRVVFRTAATAIELDALPTKTAYVGVPPLPDGVRPACRRPSHPAGERDRRQRPDPGHDYRIL